MDDNSPRAERGPVVDRRNALKLSGIAGLASVTGCLGGGTGGGSGGSGPIKVGLLADRTGGLAAAGIPMYKVAQYWRDQVNDRDGILGRDVELIAPDPQSSNQQYQNQAQKLILEDDVDVLVGGITSASREAMRPTIDDNSQLYFYPTQYEGGVCDEFTYVTAPTATQQLRPLVDHMMENFGMNAYFIAADYNFGQISADWAQIYVEEAGGNVINQEFIPLSVSDFGSTIDRIQGTDADWVLSLTVGANHVAFYKQAESAGVDLPMASTTAIGGTYEHQTTSPPVMSNLYGGWNYLEELESESNQAFVESVREAYPDTPYVNQMAEGVFLAMRLYEEAVTEAETTDMQSVHQVLEGGLSIDSPQGQVAVDPATHHLTQSVTVTRVTEDHSVEILDSQDGLEPTWLQDNCSLDEESTWSDPRTEMLKPDP